MSKYLIDVDCIFSDVVEVEADTPEQAKDKAKLAVAERFGVFSSETKEFLEFDEMIVTNVEVQ
jgi:hypothetical protein